MMNEPFAPEPAEIGLVEGSAARKNPYGAFAIRAALGIAVVALLLRHYDARPVFHALARERLGDTLYDLGRKPEALAAYRDAASVDPESPTSRIGAARCISAGATIGSPPRSRRSSPTAGSACSHSSGSPPDAR